MSKDKTKKKGNEEEQQEAEFDKLFGRGRGRQSRPLRSGKKPRKKQ